LVLSPLIALIVVNVSYKYFCFSLVAIQNKTFIDSTHELEEMMLLEIAKNPFSFLALLLCHPATTI
jgi:hypothetical protein